MKFSCFLIFIFSFFYLEKGTAYPEFIGYGYSSCMTCHNNGLGGGPLSDYGRGVWAAEITSRALFKNSTPEELAAHSGFFGSWPAPAWFRPTIKYRGLWLQTQPKSSQTQEKYYHMQVDLNLTSAFTENEKILLSYTSGYTPTPTMAGTQNLNRFLAREYYLRLTIAEKLWLYLGLMDKAFGIRHVDHTSYTRTLTGNTQKDQTEGATLHKSTDDYEWAISLFAGQPYLTKEQKDKGLSLWSEKTLGEKSRLGLSLLATTNDSTERQAVALHSRWGITTGSSLMAEYGVVQNKVKATATSQTGGYGFLESMVLLQRGYFLKTNFQVSNSEYKPDSPNNWRVSVGAVTFPLPRIEARTDLVHNRVISTKDGSPDTWSLQGQIHAVW